MSKPKAILLLSGGFDSAVAGHLAQKEFELIALHASLAPITGDEAEEKTKTLAKQLGITTLYSIPVGTVLQDFVKQANHKLYFVFFKRFIIRLAEKLAQQEHAVAIITGESLGQVSSQTLSNLHAIDAVTQMPILRPLLSFNKQEIIDLAKKIGTHDTSVGPELCDILGPPKPATHSSPEELAEEEAKIDGEQFLTTAFQEIHFLLK